ncbi:hypothetical protein KFL_005120020 [Klebsormidium nitens]|uniref:Uncharacterized protein n=1 Tax=Klebsormidium nitens TaxID=105231 RepID=A0A1Y1IJN4_KLENI|nr:hypothetical protein KFL_005120020 [Klebsormidium nitens]|eukprot:GAQ89331.1 hypothetical protein KFL_005120020 [Klebsormidium nitens]
MDSGKRPCPRTGENFNYATSGAQLALAYRNDMQGCVTGLNKLCPYLDPAAVTASGSVYDAQNATVTATAANPVGFCQPNCVRARSNYDACWVAFYSKYFSSVDLGGATLSADGSTWTQLNGQNLTTFCAPYTSGAFARGAVSLLVLLVSGAALVFSLL